MEIFEEAEKQLDSFLSSSPACPVPLHKNSAQESEVCEAQFSLHTHPQTLFAGFSPKGPSSFPNELVLPESTLYAENHLPKRLFYKELTQSVDDLPDQQQPPCEKPMRQYQQPCEKPVHQQPSSVPTFLPQRGQNPRPVSISGKMQAPAGPVVGTGFHQEHMRMSKGYEQASGSSFVPLLFLLLCCFCFWVAKSTLFLQLIMGSGFSRRASASGKMQGVV